MLIEGMQKLTLLDFPGKVACTLFAHGCNLRCPFCHNAGLVVRKPEAEITKEELCAFFNKRKGILDGICLTGGEPLLQRDAVEFIEFLRSFGLKIKLDTNGAFPERLAEIIGKGLVDYIAMDIKSSPEGYARATGIQDIDIAPFKKSVELIMNSGIDYEFRTTAVKGIHTEADFIGISNWISGARHYYIQQFTDSGDLIENGFEAFSKQESERFLGLVKQKLPNAELRGL